MLKKWIAFLCSLVLVVGLLTVLPMAAEVEAAETVGNYQVGYARVDINPYVEDGNLASGIMALPLYGSGDVWNRLSTYGLVDDNGDGKITEEDGLNFHSSFKNRQKYDRKLPFFLSEYGGIRWTEDHAGWGYGQAPQSAEEFLTRLKGLTDVLLDNPNIMGLCYTQLTDVEQEQNGLYTYDRRPKFDPAVIYPIFAKKAAIED
jgi:hypothetical protein